MLAKQGSEAVMNQTSLILEGDRAFRITRTFNGPPRIVYEALTKPEHVRRWWAPRSHGVTIVSVDADVRVGGTYRYVFRNRDGSTMAFTGKYNEITPNKRLVQTEFFEPTAGGVQPGDQGIVVTVTLEERDGKTLLTSHSLCPSPQVRDMIMQSGMEKGMRESYDQLDELVASLS